MLIGVCDDEAIIRNELIKFCEAFKGTCLISYDIVGFASGEELLRYREPIDILFLDVQMKGMNGLATAARIREKGDTMMIIFVTGYRNFMQAGYHVKAFRYLLKPLKEDDFKVTMREAMEELTRNTKAIVKKDGSTVFLRLKDIIYVEYVNRYTVVRTINCYYESTMTMNEWQGLLNNGEFYRVHKAYIVNMDYVEEIGNQIKMENGEKVQLAFRQAAPFRKACKDYRRKHAR